MKIFPAIDLKDKKVVRLTQGDYNKVDIYSDDAARIASDFAKQGAEYLHVVDLDGAKDGQLSNYNVVEKIIKATNMFVEIGGGIRDMHRIEQYLNIGVGRVILGTAAIKDPDFLQKAVNMFGEKIAVGVDAKDGYVATDGWLNVTKVNGVEFCSNLAGIGVKNIIYTDISCDGLMQGINITASGGISHIDEIIALRDMGVHSAIVGKAIYIGVLNLKQVIEIASK